MQFGKALMSNNSGMTLSMPQPQDTAQTVICKPRNGPTRLQMNAEHRHT